MGKSLYKTASSLSSILLKQVPQAEFWDKSEFNQQCPSRLLNFCRDGTMRYVNLQFRILIICLVLFIYLTIQ